MRDFNKICAVSIILGGAFISAHGQTATTIKWQDALRQSPQWYATADALRIADSVILYQRDSGGWPKNIDMAARLNETQRRQISSEKGEVDSTIDNSTTYTQMRFLARVYSATRLARYEQSFLKGFDYLLKAQYDNGGWPQYYPIRRGYYQRITFNDDAMIGVMELLRDVAQAKSDFTFVDENRRRRADLAVRKGIECILKTQVAVHGKRPSGVRNTTKRPLRRRRRAPMN